MDDKEPLSQEEIERLQQQGRLCYRPVEEDGKFHTSDGTNYTRDPKTGTFRRDKSMSKKLEKKLRKKRRKQTLADEKKPFELELPADKGELNHEQKS